LKSLICYSCENYEDPGVCSYRRILPTKKNQCDIFVPRTKPPFPFEHGGARPGAGRPKKKQKKQVRAFALSAQVVDFIDQYSHTNKISKSQAVESIINSCI
jgi:hypothetical protein